MTHLGKSLAVLNDVLPEGADSGWYAIVLAAPDGERYLSVIALGDKALPNGDHAQVIGLVTDSPTYWTQRLAASGYPTWPQLTWIPSSGGTWTARITHA